MSAATKTKKKPNPKEVREGANLDRRYGEIGISAVAAAVRYSCHNKNPAYAPVVHRPRDHDRDTAA